MSETITNPGATETAGATTIDFSNLDETTVNALLENDAIKAIIAKREQSVADKIRTEKVKALKETEEKAKTEIEMLQERLSILELERLENEKTKVIEAVGLDLKARKFVTGTNFEEMKQSALELKTWFEEKEAKTIEAKFKEHGTDANPGKKKPGKVDVSKLTYAERIELYKSNPELFK